MLEYWGERCEDYEEGCVVCDAWCEYDNLVMDNKIANEIAQKSFTDIPKDTQFVPPISLTKVQKPTLSEWMAWLKQGEK
jgi:hypothetical protein